MDDTPESTTMTLGDLLYQKEVLVINPPLATAIGLNESIIIQQMNYWLKHSTHVHGDQRWIYNTYTQWQDQFPFWSVSTIKRTIRKLEEIGVLVSTDRLNTHKSDRTKWYTINYQYSQLNIGETKMTQWGDQNDPLEEVKLTPSSLDRDYTETTPYISFSNDAPPSRTKPGEPETDAFAAFWSAYPKGKGNKQQAMAQWRRIGPDDATVAEIMAGLDRWKGSKRWQEGYIKAAEIWLRDRWWDDDVEVAPRKQADKHGGLLYG